MKKIPYILVLISFLSTNNLWSQSTPMFDNTDSISHIILPNVFTPNFDSINDIYKPYLDEMKSVSFSIYNRYGILIFETNRVNGFWDGRTTSGEPCKDGVYFCVLTGVGIEGKEYKEKSFVQLYTNGYYNK